MKACRTCGTNMRSDSSNLEVRTIIHERFTYWDPVVPIVMNIF